MAKKVNGEVLMSRFNKVINGHLRINNPSNVTIMETLIEKGYTPDVLMNTAEDWVLENPNFKMDKAVNLFFKFAMDRLKNSISPLSAVWHNGKRITPTYPFEPVEPKPIKFEPKPIKSSINPSTGEIVEEPEPIVNQPVTNAESQAAGFLSGLGDLLVNVVAKDKTAEIVETVKREAVTAVEQFVHDTYGDLPKKTIVKIGDKPIRTIQGLTHEKFDDVLNCVSRHLPVFMVGGAGTGKNVLAEQIAEALDVPFYFGGAITQEYKLTGFTDANGTYHETPFYKAFSGGGVYFQDEWDASIAEVAILTNSAVANGYMDFPAPIGNVKAHPDFYFIAAGNTYGLGADYEYVGRNVLDAATLNRMVVIKIDYSPKIEELYANGDNDLLRFCRQFREAARKCGVKTICSYRNIKALSLMSECIDIPNAIDYALTSSLKYDDMNVLMTHLHNCGRWSMGFMQLIDEKRRLING